MDPIATVNEALAALDALLSIINAIRGQGGMTDDAILAAAQQQTLKNSAQIQALLAALPPAA
jgi:hypothetical protein